MDDKSFDDIEISNEWIRMIEREGPTLRDSDIYPLLNNWMADCAPEHILDLGCGQGVCSSKIDLLGRNYTGTDASPFLIARAKKLYAAAKREFVLGNVYELPFKDETFDGAFSILLWHLLSDLKTAANELSRILKPTGSFLIVTANSNSISAWEEFKSSKDVLYFHSLAEITDSLRQAGLSISEAKSFRISEKAKEGLLIAIEGRRSLE